MEERNLTLLEERNRLEPDQWKLFAQEKVNSAILDDIENMEKVVWGVSKKLPRPEDRWELQSGFVYAVNYLFFVFCNIMSNEEY